MVLRLSDEKWAVDGKKNAFAEKKREKDENTKNCYSPWDNKFPSKLIKGTDD